MLIRDHHKGSRVSLDNFLGLFNAHWNIGTLGLTRAHLESFRFIESLLVWDQLLLLNLFDVTHLLSDTQSLHLAVWIKMKRKHTVVERKAIKN